MWGPLAKQDFTQWDKHPIETLHAEFCKILLHVQRKTTNNACRAELGQYPQIIKTQKRAIKFWKHLKYSDPLSYHYQALQYQELSKDKSPLIQLVLGLSSQTCSTNILKPQDQNIQINQNKTDYNTVKTRLHCLLGNTNTKQNAVLSGPKLTIHRG